MQRRSFVGNSAGWTLGLAWAGLGAQTAIEMSEGEVRRIDRGNLKITIRHGEIKNLDMPPMSMVFQLGDPALLDKVKVGDKIRFAAEKHEGAYMVTAIEPKN